MNIDSDGEDAGMDDEYGDELGDFDEEDEGEVIKNEMAKDDKPKKIDKERQIG